MSRFHRTTAPRSQHAPEPAPNAAPSAAPETGPPTSPIHAATPHGAPPSVPRTRTGHDAPPSVPRTRTGAAWVAVCAATLIAVALIVFLVQNTRTVEISFLGMTTSTSLALALLIAAVGGILLTLILGTARITQLRRHLRKHPQQTRHDGGPASG